MKKWEVVIPVTLSIILIAIIAMVTLGPELKQRQSVRASLQMTDTGYGVVKLFDFNNCSIYRFGDGGERVRFIICNDGTGQILQSE
jgi:hypothetical protein